MMQTRKSKRSFRLETLTPAQLVDLSKGYRKKGMKEQDDPQERKRLFHQATLMRGLAKIKAKRLAKANSPEPSPFPTPSSPNAKVDASPTNTPRTLPENDSLLNREACQWLKAAKLQPEPPHLHLLTFAWWGWENGVRGDCPKDRTYALEMQVELLFGWKPENVMTWLFNHPDGPEDPLEQEESLLIWLRTASSPLRAASGVLSEIWYRQQADCLTLR